MPALTALLLAACNTAPLDDGNAIAPGGRAGWYHPSDDICYDPHPVEIDGYLYCERRKPFEPVDDPIYVPCDQVGPTDEEVVFAVDGTMARAWLESEMAGREVVNDWWGDEPLLVDY